jgi:predicted cupin superfamily sugar epimerase
VIDELVERHQLEPHPEGGFYRRLWQHPVERDGRPLGTATLYLLPGGVHSRWHRIDTVEHWHVGRGAPLELRTSSDGREVRRRILGAGDDELLFATVDPNEWQSARSQGDWSLVVVTVVPGFSWDGFELAPEGWEPGST